MLVPAKLLDAKSDTTPGDAMPLQDFIYVASCFIKPSSDFTASGGVSVLYEMSDDRNGPWKNIDDQGVGSAGAMTVESLGGFTSGHFIPWIRAKLSAAPLTGSVTVNVYAKVFNG